MSHRRDVSRHTFIQPGEADAKARHMAARSHHNWIVWESRDGQAQFAQIRCRASVKAALLSMGTQGEFTDYMASTATGESCSWQRGIVLLQYLP